MDFKNEKNIREDECQVIQLRQPYEVSRAVYKCGSSERKLLYFASRKIQAQKRGKIRVFTASFKISEMLYALGMKNQTNNRKHIRQAVESIMSKNEIIFQNDDNTFEASVWLSYAKVDDKNDMVSLQFSERIGELFEMCKERFSLINLKVIGGLTSYYAMRFYEIALSFMGFMGKRGNPQNSWYFDLSVDDVKQLFKIESGYDNRLDNFTNKIIKAPINELNDKNPDFQIEVKILKSENDARKTVGYSFICKALTRESLLEAQDSETRDNIKKMKDKYPEEFFSRLGLRFAEKKPFEFQELLELEIYQKMRNEGFRL